ARDAARRRGPALPRLDAAAARARRRRARFDGSPRARDPRGRRGDRPRAAPLASRAARAVLVRAPARARRRALPPEPAARAGPRGPVIGAVPEEPETAVSPGSLQGIGCSPGRASGVARVVLDPHAAGDVRNAILVSRMTDPGWVFLMVAARGLVVERGSLLS